MSDHIRSLPTETDNLAHLSIHPAESGSSRLHNLAAGLLIASLLLITVFGCTQESLPEADPDDFRDWSSYLGDKASTQYTSLDQINRDNVDQLEVAWTYSTGDAIGDRTEMQTNPLIIDGVLYGISAQLKLFALDASTGEELWVFDPFEGEEPRARGRQRGMVYWADGDDRRIVYTAGPRLYAVNIENGEPVLEFGENGSIDYAIGLDRDAFNIQVTATTPGVVYKDLLIQGSTVYNRAPGHIRAFNIRTGEIEWTFRTIPYPGEYGYETWPENAWTRVGNANSWAGMSLDEERGIVYVPTASPGHDFYGGDRVGDNLFGTSLIALDASTGERIWHYQFVRHDIWDRDLPAPPNLVTIRRDGRVVDAVAQITKSGHVFVFDRETGEPLFPMREVDVPPSDVPGEVAPDSQPEPELPAPFARQEFTEDDITDISEESHQVVLERFREIRTDHRWEPPSKEGTLIFPGFDGGAEWGGAAVDPNSGILYVNANEMPWILTMVQVESDDDDVVTSRGRQIYTMNCASCHGMDMEGAGGGQYPELGGIEHLMSEEEIRSVIADGQGVMPPFGHLSDEEMDDLVDYLLGREESDPQDLAADEDERYIDDTDEPDAIEELTAVPYTHTGYNRFFDPEGYPAVKPPWGTLNAIDLNSGEHLWNVPLGEFDELTERGIPQTGTENYGGPVATAGGLLFIGASQDERFRAFDKETGDVLFETDLPAGGYATPAVYEIDGQQYVVIAAGGGKMGTASGDTYVAFTLPAE